MRILTMIALAMATLTLLACASTTDTDPGDAAASAVGVWSLTHIEDDRYDLPQGARTPTLTINADGDISGQAGINRYSGTADAQAMADGDWSAGGVVMTRMGGEPQAMAFEQRFIAMLQRADTVETGPQWLELRAGGLELLRFTRAGQ
jgi:heat shock protein HslJ